MPRKLLRPLTNVLRSGMGTNGIAGRIEALETATRELLTTAQHQTTAAPPSQDVMGTNAIAERIEALEAVTREVLTTIQHQVLAASSTQEHTTGALRSAQFIDINNLMHHSRGALLRTMPPGAQRLLSAGCAGNWYFDWIEETYGRVPEHLGIEFYSPKPEGLPSNVTWISNTASDMSEVDADYCDLVVSGQNLEHLWPEEVSGFLLEAARVLKPGGHLVVDSPNRLITAPLKWSHPEHTIELTHTEIMALMRLAGFDITASHGVWLSRDERDGRILAFDPKVPVPGWSITERLILARDRPSDSFIWWVEAVRSDRAPDAAATHAMMADLFSEHWPERVQRLLVPPGHTSRITEEGEWIESTAGQGGIAIYGPYMPLRAGRHRVTWQIRPAPGARTPVAICDVVAEGVSGALASCEVGDLDETVTLEFDLPTTTFGLQFRCSNTGGAGFSVLRKVRLEEDIMEYRDSVG